MLNEGEKTVSRPHLHSIKLNNLKQKNKKASNPKKGTLVQIALIKYPLGHIKNSP